MGNFRIFVPSEMCHIIGNEKQTFLIHKVEIEIHVQGVPKKFIPTK